MDQKGWVANHDGNLSVRTGNQTFAVTPTARAKFSISSQDIFEVDQSGNTVSGQGKVFSEWGVHSRIYQKRNEVHAVVHAHPPYATAVGCANQEMMTTALPEAVVSLGPGIPLVGLALPGSSPFFTELDALIPHYDAIMVAGNGVFSWGKDLEQAFLRLELVEHLAHIFLESHRLGGPKLLSSDQVKILMSKRLEAGLSLPPDPQRLQWFE
jgi:L-fuculose-phosphate aldolase